MHTGLTRGLQPSHEPSPAANNLLRTVLLIDVEVQRAALAKGFTGRGCEVWGADTIAEAVAIAERQQPDLVVTELRLPDGGWRALLPKLAPIAPQAKVMVLTNFGSIATAVGAIRAGATAFLAKPATAGQILADLGDVSPPANDDGVEVGRHRTLDRAVWEHITHVLENAGSLAETARRLGVDRRSLRRMLAKNPPPF